jgi:hypothetical protein
MAALKSWGSTVTLTKRLGILVVGCSPHEKRVWGWLEKVVSVPCPQETNAVIFPANMVKILPW